MNKNLPNNSKMAECYSIFALKFDSIHQFYELPSTRLRLQSFGIRLNDEPRVGTQFAEV